MALSVGVVILWTQLFPTQPPTPPPAAPVAGQNAPARRLRPGTAPAAPAAGHARRAVRPRARPRRRSRIGPSGCWSCRRPRCATCSPAWAGRWCTRSCAGSSSSRTRRIAASGHDVVRTKDAANAPLRIDVSRLRHSRRRPTAPGKRASRRPTRSCSRPTSAPSTSRSATALDKARYRLQFDVVVANRGDAARSVASWRCRSAAARTPTSAAAASSRACRPTSRRRSASSTAASNASRSRAWHRSPIQDKVGTVQLDRDRREVLPARRGSLSRGAGPSRAPAGRCRPAPTSAR